MVFILIAWKRSMFWINIAILCLLLLLLWLLLLCRGNFLSIQGFRLRLFLAIFIRSWRDLIYLIIAISWKWISVQSLVSDLRFNYLRLQCIIDCTLKNLVMSFDKSGGPIVSGAIRFVSRIVALICIKYLLFLC